MSLVVSLGDLSTMAFCELSALRSGPWFMTLTKVVLSLYFLMRPTWNACLNYKFLSSSRLD